MSSYWSGPLLVVPNLGAAAVPAEIIGGVEGLGIAGNVLVGHSATGSGVGVLGTSALGVVSIVRTGNISITGVQGTGFVGSVSGAIVSTTLGSGVSCTGGVGSVTIDIGSSGNVNVVGVSCAVELGSVTSWGDIQDSVRTTWIEIN